jgi:2-polyprenyl-3-methyl-5-hydroxy-6-metoxy-1,4-benzoquinol methylase/uncharacterized protein YbaR (Trm112 family)
VDAELFDRLVCPRSKKPLTRRGDRLVSVDGYEYPIIENIPIMLVDEAEATHPAFAKALKYRSVTTPEPTAGLSVDLYVQEQIAATNGNLYVSLIGNLKTYPIPEIRLPQGHGAWLLDIGCNWGRWCLSAAQKGYRVIGIDPNLDAILAAQRVSRQLGLSIKYVVADSRYLPFKHNTFDHVFSYSVLQHLSKENVRKTLAEIAEVLKPGGQSTIQMPNMMGIRNLYNQVRFGLKPDHQANIFRVRYWSNSELKQTFSSQIGTSLISVDGYFGLGIQATDIELLPPLYQLIVRSSEFLRRVSLKIPLLTYLADSVYVTSTRTS